MVYIPYRSLIEALYTLNSPPIVSSNTVASHRGTLPEQRRSSLLRLPGPPGMFFRLSRGERMTTRLFDKGRSPSLLGLGFFFRILPAGRIVHEFLGLRL